MVDIIKALTTSTNTASSTNSVLIPQEIDSMIVELAVNETPLLKLFKEIPWDTNSYEWNERSALVSAGAYNETDTFSEQNSTYERKNVTIKMIKADGAVSNLLQLTSRNLINTLAAEIESAAQSLAQKIEHMYIQGNVGVSSKEFDGLSNLITQTTSASGACISLDILDAAINLVVLGTGKPGLILLANRDLHQLYKEMRAKMSYWYDKVQVADGVALTHYRGTPLYGSAYVPTTQGGTGAQSYGFVIDSSNLVVPVVQPIKYEDMTAKVTTDSMGFRIKTYRSLAVKGVAYKHCKITTIGAPV